MRVLTRPVQRGPDTYVVQVVQDISGEQRLLGDLLHGAARRRLARGASGRWSLGAIYAGRALVPIRESLRRQREFAADASHEFRTPLAVIRSSVDYLERHATSRSAASARPCATSATRWST